MPKSKKPAGGRPAKNYDPNRAPKAGAAGSRGTKPGSRSPKHRGYRPEEEATAPKRRWSADERSAKASVRGERPQSAERVTRADRVDRAERDERRPLVRSERPRFDHVERPERERHNRPSRSDRPRFDRDDRVARSDRDDRVARSDRAARPQRGARPNPSARTERPARRDSSFYPEKSTAKFAPQDDVVLERLEAQSTLATDVEGVTFADLGLGGNICRALDELGAVTPFAIQAATIPMVLAGRDVLGRGRTGSGKTIAFGAPLVERLMENGGGKDRKMGRAPRALIMAPTRELALQIDRTVQPIARSVGLFTTQIYGGVPQGRQVSALRRGVDIVIATPGRLEDLVEQGHLDLSKIHLVVLDEADHMCDLGFLEPVQRILRQLAPDAQHLLFSATLDRGVAAIIDEFLENPSVHEVAGEDQASSTIDHRVFVVDHKDKPEVIRELCERNGKTLIFTRTRAFAEMLADQLDDAGIPSTSLHGDLNQNRRTRNLGLLTSGRVDVLVATDVAARGIHVDDIDLVIQADAPDEYKTYLHRAGRTGRAGRAGTVVTIVPKTRQRRMAELLDRADIDAQLELVRPGDDAIAELTRVN